jgi:hypothetical protein
MIYKSNLDNANIDNNILKYYSDLQKISKDINYIFKDSNDIIKKTLLKKNIKTRNNKISFIDAISYIFNYSFVGATKQSVVADYNHDNKKDGNRSNYYKKELKIPLSYYNDIFIKTKCILDKYINKSKNPFNVIAVDGTYNNTNIHNDKKLETCLNMGYYDATNHIPIDLEIKGTEYKNKKIKSFIEHLKCNNYNDIANMIFVFDRAYFCYDFINTLNENKLNYVIRVKNNCVCLNNDEQIQNKIKDNNIRFISYEDEITYEKKDKDNNIVKLKETIKCHLVTNLLETKFSNDLVKKIYLMRWDVEVFFKFIKYNFNFACLREHTKNTIEQYKKKYLIILINVHLMRLIEYVYDKYNKKKKQIIKKKNTNKHEYNIKHNESLMIHGLKKIINIIIKSKLKKDDLIHYCKNYIENTNTIKNISNPRISKTPFTKWYVMSYSDYYKYKKIIEALKNNDLESLNKNLKLLALNIQIIK